MRRFRVAVLILTADPATPDTAIVDSELRAAWVRYRSSLGTSPGADAALATAERAELHFGREGVIEGRLHARLFRYFPMAALAIGALNLAFAVIDAKSAGMPFSQLLAAVRPAGVAATAAVVIAVLMWLTQAQTLSWLSSILRAIWLDLDATFLRHESAPDTGVEKSLSDILQAGLEALRLPLQQLSSQQAEIAETVLKSIDLLCRENGEKEALERELLVRKLGEVVSDLTDDAKAISEFHLATAHKLADQSKAALEALAEDVKAHASTIGTLGRSEIGRLSADAQRAIETLRAAAGDHQAAIESSTQSLRSSAGELAASVELIGGGATNLKEVAREFLRAGMGLTSAFEKSTGLGDELRVAAEAMAKASGDIEKMAGSYSQSRDAFASLADELGSYLEGARQERDSRGQAAKKLEEVCHKLVEIQERSFKGMQSHHAVVANTLTSLQKPAAELSAGVRAVDSSANRLLIIARDLVKRSAANETAGRKSREEELEQAIETFRATPARRRTA